MKVSLDELRGYPQHKMTVDFKETIDGLGAVKPVLGVLTIFANASGVRLSGKVQTLLKLNCDRCLRPYFQAVSLELDERFVDASVLEAPLERELRGDEFVDAIPEDGIIDISDVVRQAITLATPSYCMCGEECPGYPKSTSSDDKSSLADDKDRAKSIDPRWKNLKTLFSTDEKVENS